MKRSGVICILFVVVLLLISTEAKKKQRKFDGDFEFADENEETKAVRKDAKKWFLDPGSDLCQALKCKKKELCLLEDEFTAVCVSKKELHKNGDVIVPKSKLKEASAQTSSKVDVDNEKDSYDEDEDDDSYYDDDDESNEDFFPKNKVDKANAMAKSSAAANSVSRVGLGGMSGSDNNGFKSCTPCPVVKPTFICGSDNRTYSSLCRLDYHNCIGSSQVTVGCKGFCPCKESVQKTNDYSKYVGKKTWGSGKQSKSAVYQKYQPKTFPSSTLSKKSKNLSNLTPNQIGFGPSPDDNGVFSRNDFASGTATSASVKDRYTKYKDYYGYKSSKTVGDKQRSHNEVINIKPVSTRDCTDEALEAMGNRLLDWFQVVMTDTQKRKLNRKNRNSQVHFPGDCKREVQWMFSHLNTEDDGQLSLQELFDLENDRNEKCIKPFLDRCDTDKDIFISPREFCSCFAKACRGVNCGSYSTRDDNELDDEDDDDSDIDGSSGDGELD